MHDQRKKISLARFERAPGKVMAYVQTAKVTVVVYNDHGPVVTLSPYRETLPPRRPARLPRIGLNQSLASLSLADAACDEAGVWRLDEETKQELTTSKRAKKSSRFSPASLFRLTPALPLLAWFKS